MQLRLREGRQLALDHTANTGSQPWPRPQPVSGVPGPSAPGKACFTWPWEPQARIILELAEETAGIQLNTTHLAFVAMRATPQAPSDQVPTVRPHT